MNITIAIPTYNRNEILKSNLEFLLPQLTSDEQLLIIDNHSDIPVEETLKDLLARYKNVNYSILRNRINVGGNQNIMRCFEYTDTDWLWLLGDDDKVLPNAIETIKKTIKKDPDLAYINFRNLSNYHESVRNRRESIFVRGQDELTEKMETLEHLNFMSVDVFRMTDVAKYLYLVSQFTYSCSAQTAMALLLLGNDKKACLSHEDIIDVAGAPIGENCYSSLWVYLGISTLLELPISATARKNIARHIYTDYAKPINVVIELLARTGRDQASLDQNLIFYQAIYERLFAHSPYFRDRVAGRFLYFVLKYPAWLLPIAKLPFNRLKKKHMRKVTLPNLYGR
jgi:glycosyltransferase involved in cell wall biosynthesis